MTRGDKIKMALCGVLAAMAVVLAVTAVTDIGNNAAAAGEALYAQGADTEYVLRAYEGYVGIFAGGSGKTPVTVTDIEVASLREADRALLSEGIAVYGWEALQQLLEDLGS